MIVYNVTIGVDREIADEWLSWMKSTHIPDVMKTGMFVEYKIFKVLSHDDENSFSFAIQYFASSMDLVQTYLKDHAPRLRDDVQKRYGNRQLAYRTLLEQV